MSRLAQNITTVPYSEFQQMRTTKRLRKGISLTSVNAASAQTYSVSDLFNGGINRSGQTSPANDVLPTATEFRNEFASRTGISPNLLPALTSMDFTIYNANAVNSILINAGTNVTLFGRNIVAQGRATKIKVIISNNFGLVTADAYMMYGHR